TVNQVKTSSCRGVLRSSGLQGRRRSFVYETFQKKLILFMFERCRFTFG
ncbi:unnamed protein product, partial [Linum tenue]